MKVPSLDAAEQFVWLNARLIDRLRFACLFRGGAREKVLAALAPYQNDDGGFGNALEPDLRGPISQPQPVEVALRIRDEVDAFSGPMVARALDYLVTVTSRDGGVPFVLPSVRPYPRAPWWQAPDDPPGGLNPTAAIAGLLHKHKTDHPWLGPATEFCWSGIQSLQTTDPYEARAVTVFLDHVPDRARAEAAFERVGRMILDQELVALDPEAPGEVHSPVDFAPDPDTLARRLFADELFERHLDHLVDSQQEDGGRHDHWQIWTKVTDPEWRGWMTVHTLRRLHAHGRLPLASRGPAAPAP